MTAPKDIRFFNRDWHVIGDKKSPARTLGWILVFQSIYWRKEFPETDRAVLELCRGGQSDDASGRQGIVINGSAGRQCCTERERRLSSFSVGGYPQ